MTIRLRYPLTSDSSVTPKLFAYFVDGHQLFSSVRSRLVQWDEFYDFGWLSLVAEWCRDDI